MPRAPLPDLRSSSVPPFEQEARGEPAMAMRDSRQAARLPAAIEALARSLPGARVPPETFRLAKFDRPQVSLAFWKLLYCLLKQIQGGRGVELLDTGTQVRFVKSAVSNCGYRRLAFYLLPSDGSKGSRELLLVFSWLLCRISLVEQLLTRSSLELGDETMLCMCDAPLKSLPPDRTPGPKPHSEGQRDVRYVQWLNGRLQFHWRSCHMDRQELCKLLYKVHSYTLGCHAEPAVGHFSVTEADVARQPDSYKEFLQLTESESARLEAFFGWKPLEPVYWRWMETVLGTEEENEKLPNVCDKDGVLPSTTRGCAGLGQIIEDIDRCREDLMTLHDGLRELVTLRQLGCCEKVRARKQELLGEREFCKAARKAQDVAELKAFDFKCHSSACGINKVHGPYRLVFKGKYLKGSKMAFVRSAPSKAITEGITATDVISELRKKEARLKAELRLQQEQDRQKLHKAAEALGQMLLIPPVKRQEAKDTD